MRNDLLRSSCDTEDGNLVGVSTLSTIDAPSRLFTAIQGLMTLAVRNRMESQAKRNTGFFVETNEGMQGYSFETKEWPKYIVRDSSSDSNLNGWIRFFVFFVRNLTFVRFL